MAGAWRFEAPDQHQRQAGHQGGAFHKVRAARQRTLRTLVPVVFAALVRPTPVSPARRDPVLIAAFDALPGEGVTFAAFLAVTAVFFDAAASPLAAERFLPARSSRVTPGYVAFSSALIAGSRVSRRPEGAVISARRWPVALAA